MPAARPRRSAAAIVALAAGALLFALGTCELVLRLWQPEPRVPGALSFQLADGTPIDAAEGARRGAFVPVPPPRPRMRWMIAPGTSFFLCYADQRALRRDWLDAEGRVPVRINRFGLREREEITPDKPAGQRRIVCVGDSFTFGWGIPEELGWVRCLEDELRANGSDVRTVNCGAAGTVCVDEYVHALQHRFHVFQPDAVVLTICLNDLIPSSGLSVIDPVRPTGVRVLDLARAVFGRRPLDLDPSRDWVQELLDLPREQALASGMATAERPDSTDDKPFEAMWSQGVPQRSLREAKAWCGARGIPLLVVLWPFLQGLGPGRHYPFAKLHELVAADCAAAAIPFLDVLPALRAVDDEDLWVTPADMHANPRAHALALPAIVAAVRAATRW
jgi:hypothetical protein